MSIRCLKFNLKKKILCVFLGCIFGQCFHLLFWAFKALGCHLFGAEEGGWLQLPVNLTTFSICIMHGLLMCHQLTFRWKLSSQKLQLLLQWYTSVNTHTSQNFILKAIFNLSLQFFSIMFKGVNTDHVAKELARLLQHWLGNNKFHAAQILELFRDNFGRNENYYNSANFQPFDL